MTQCRAGNRSLPDTCILPVMHARPFTRMARHYDGVMEDIEYDEWASFVLELLAQEGLNPTRLLDLGCGTGASTQPFVTHVPHVEGMDLSAEMLEVAAGRLPGVPLHQNDARTFTIKGRFDAVTAVFDVVNNLLTDEDFVAMLQRVHTHLTPGGIFVFDANTTPGLQDLWEDGRVEGWAGDTHYLWEHHFDEASGLATVRAKFEEPGGAFHEVHTERPYDPHDIKRLARTAGYSQVRVVRYPDGAMPDADEPRVWAVLTR